MGYEYILIVAIGILIWVSINGQNKSIEKRLKHTEILLKKVAEHVGVAEDPINERLRLLVNEGKMVEAVKETREYFGYSLLEAKQYVDGL